MTVSDVAERLEGAGFIRREPDPGDSRAKLVRVTPQGAVLLDRMRETASGILGRALAGLAEDDRTMLADLLGQVIANLQDRP
ncbi:MAG: MarR family transcriptional regulator, partial [Paracoccus sp.]|nr:MarR family transcriptional regulator [Paracoccus sp. (in: a-proteobacteria)]